jgi:hypothetical protein
LHSLEADLLATGRFNACLGISDESLSVAEILSRAHKLLLAFAEAGILSGQLGRALANLLPERRYASAPVLELGRSLARRLLAPTLALGERLPGRFQLGVSLGHP